jgi:trimeric autotransporter adhesin
MSPSPVRITLFILLLGVLLACPFVTAISLSPGSSFSGAPVIANGDPVSISGIATGHPSEGLQVWLFGNNYMKITTVSPNADNSYEYELKSADTNTLAPGQYFVLIQHPMMNGQFDIYYDAATGSVINRQLGTGTTIFQLTGTGSLQTPAGANTLMQAISSQNVDDTFAATSFIVSPPTAFINPVGDHAVGDMFTINGSTNLAAGDNLMVEITSSSFKPTTKSQSAEFSGASGMVKVVQGSGALNRWSFPVDASTFKPDEYIVKVSGITIDVSGSTLFNIVAAQPTTLATPAPIITTPALPPVVTTTPVPAPVPTTRKSPLSVTGIIGAVGLAALATMARRK